MTVIEDKERVAKYEDEDVDWITCDYPSVRTLAGQDILDCIDILKYLGFSKYTIESIITSRISNGYNSWCTRPYIPIDYQ